MLPLKLLILFALTAACRPAFAAVAKVNCALPAMQTAERPAGASPTVVSVGLWLLDVIKIDDVEQRVSVDFLVYQSWIDARLDELAGCRVGLDRVWSPHLSILNSGKVEPNLPENVTIGPGGKLQYVQRYQGSLSFRHRLHNFPFDRHRLRISLVPVEYLEHEVKLATYEAVTGQEPMFTILDWNFQTAQASIRSLANAQTGVTVSRYDFEVPAHRRPNYFVWKIILPLILIVAMSWSVFWIDPAQFGPQVGMSATAMLTLVAFQFGSGNILPRLSYFTVLDKFIFGATVIVFLALVESLLAAYKVSCKRVEFARSMDRVCRIVFPSAFLVMMLYVFRTVF